MAMMKIMNRSGNGGDGPGLVTSSVHVISLTNIHTFLHMIIVTFTHSFDWDEHS